MKLYYSPGSCALAPHIVLTELGLSFELEKVDLKTKQTASSKDFNAINGKSSVPVLALDNGELLTEAAIIMQYIADQKPEKNLIPKAGTWERYRVLEMMNFISTELHKGIGPLWGLQKIFGANKEAAEVFTKATKARIVNRFEYLSDRMGDKPFVMGTQFTICDAYLFNMLSWCRALDIDLSSMPKLITYSESLQNRPSVQEAMYAEGLLKKG